MQDHGQSLAAQNASAHAAGLVDRPAAATASPPVRRLWLMLGATLLAGAVCLSVAGLFLSIATMFVASEQDEVAAVLDGVMQAMAAKDTDRAYDLFAGQVQGDELGRP